MTKLAQRYWASLTDSSPEVRDRLIEQGRRRDLPLWRRYIASLLDVEPTEPDRAGPERLEQDTTEREPPASTVYYTLDRAIDVGGAAPVLGGRGVFAGFALATAGVVGAVALGVSLVLVGRGAERPPAAGRPAPTVVATPSDSPSIEGTSRPPSLPPGAHQEAGGYAWATPKGWTRSVKSAAEVHYGSPDGKQELVAKSSIARGDLMKTWRAAEQNAHEGQNYQKIRLEKTTFRGNPAVVWEYTFTLKSVPWHAVLLGFNQDGKSYQINTWYQPDIEPQALKTYNKVKAGFTVL